MRRLRILLLVVLAGLVIGVAAPHAASAAWSLTIVMQGNVDGIVKDGPLVTPCQFQAVQIPPTTQSCTVTNLAPGTVSVTAVPSGLDSTATWSNCPKVVGTTCTLEAQSTDRTITVTFTRGFNVNVSVVKTGTGSGTVTSSPAGINCGPTCSATFATSTVVTLTATPAAGSFFNGWTGCQTAVVNVCTVTVDQVRNVTASFGSTPTSGNLTVTIQGGGTVVSDPAGISCGSICSFTFVSTGSVTLTENALRGYEFVAWEGCTSVAGNVCTVNLGGSKSVKAIFRDSAVVADLLTGTARQSPGGTRYAEALLRVGEPVRVVMRVVRKGRILVSKTFDLDGGTRLFSVRIPRGVAGGAARIELVLSDSAGNDAVLSRRIRIPA